MLNYTKTSGQYAFDERILEIQLKVFGSECNLDCFMCVHANSTTRQRVAERVFGMTLYLVNKIKIEKII